MDHEVRGCTTSPPKIGRTQERLKRRARGLARQLLRTSGDRALERWCVRRVEVRRLLVDAELLVVPGVGVDGPDVVVGVVADVLDRAGGGEHRVVQVVVAV